MTIQVAAAAIVRDGRVLAARRVHPADVAGGWELPGGKVRPGESADEAVVREVREELSCEVAVIRPLEGRVPVKPGYSLTAHLARLARGEPVPHEHDAARWLGPEDLDDVAWLPADRPFLPELRPLLMAGHRLAGAKVGGAVRVGRTVRGTTGAWTPAVHCLLRHLASRGIAEAPRPVGADEQGREVLTWLPGRPIAGDETVSDDLLADGLGWLRRYHDAVEGFSHPGPWRSTDRPCRPGEIVCHHDFAPYNVAVSTSAAGERVVGVFDWDMAGPGTRIQEVAFAARAWVPLRRDRPADDAARRLRLIAAAYGGGVTPAAILDAVARLRSGP